MTANDDLLWLWVVNLGGGDLKPSWGQVEWVDDNRFQISGSNAVSVDEITAGRSLLFADQITAQGEFEFHLKTWMATQREKEDQRERTKKKARNEQLKAAKTRLGVKP